jgi:ribonucleotide reductase beta subunit family protein with ferritin-like domain
MVSNNISICKEDDSHHRFVMFPIRHADIWSMYKKAIASFWTVEEISFSDASEWQRLTNNERIFLENTLAFFAASDGIVNENLVTRFYADIPIPEARAFYTFQMAIESIHSECYSLLIDTYVKNDERKSELFASLANNPTIRAKGDWAQRWIESGDSFPLRLVAFAIVEGVFFSGAFASIYFIKEKGILKSLTFSNELISRDESLHTEFAVLMYNKLLPEERLSKSEIDAIFVEAVELEKTFISDTLECGLLGLNAELMKEYIEFVANRLMTQLGYDPIFNTHSCPLDFMERISITNKSNFFEVRVAEYSRASIDKKNDTLQFEEDF